MTTPLLLLLRSVVRPFYRHNAGFFLFLFLVFFGAVAPSTQLAYHYALILGMLDTPLFLGIVLIAWLLYAGKCNNWVARSLQNPELNFLNLLSQLNKKQHFLYLLTVQATLLLPVSLYAFAITGVALHKERYGVALTIPAYIIVLSLAGARRYQYSIENPGHPGISGHPRHPSGRSTGPAPYFSFIIRYLFHANKALWKKKDCCSTGAYRFLCPPDFFSWPVCISCSCYRSRSSSVG